MTSLSTLWLPILVSTALVFAASSVIHMVLPWHRRDFHKMPNEDKFMDAVRPFTPPPGDYLVPRPSGPQEMRTPEFAEKMRVGPVLVLTVRPNGPFRMGKNLVQWFIYCAVVAFFAAYVTCHALPPGAPYLRVFQLVGATAFAGYAFGLWPMSIWYGRSWNTTVKSTIDGLVYALLTAGAFGWLWPH